MKGFKLVIGAGAVHSRFLFSENMSNWLRVSIMLNRSNGVCLDATEGCVPEETDIGCFNMTEKERVKRGALDAEANAMTKRMP